VDRPDGRVTDADFREALAHFVTGVTVVTAAGPAGPHGVTVNAFASVSLEPQLILVCIERSHLSHAILVRSRAFAVNVLAAGQEELSRFFAAAARPEGPDAFRGIAYRPGRTGAPLLDGCVAYVECRVAASHPDGDHTIFVGAVERAWAVPERRPLVYYNRAYRTLGSP